MTKSSLQNCIFAAAAFLAFSLPARAHAAQLASATLIFRTAQLPPDASSHRLLPLPGVPNFAEVTPELYRGGHPNSQGLQALAAMGINIVIDSRGFDRREQAEVNRLGMQYVSIPWHCPFPRDSVFARFLAVLRDHPHSRIFVHCRLGDDRSGMMIASYRMAEEGWTAAQAMEEMKADGFTLSHHFICPGLARYEKQFPQRYATNPVFRTAP